MPASQTTPTPAPSIPREAWAKHPRFSSQALLLGSHANFASVSATLVGRAALGAWAGLESLFDRWIGAMRSHESYEEHKLYPYLERRWGVRLNEERVGHQELHARADEVKQAFAAFTRPARAPGAVSDPEPAIVAALRAHDTTLRAHLDCEEEHVIPLLLELSPEEFDRYYHNPIRWLLQELDTREAQS